MVNKANHLYKVDTMCSDSLYTTEEHPFYVRKKYYKYDPKIRHKNGKMKKLRKFKEPQWIKAKDLNKDCYVGIAINHKWELPKWNGIYFDWSDGRRSRKSNKLKEKFNNPDFWWLIGRYIGDGWIRSQGGIIICCDYNEVHEITEKLHKLDFSYSLSDERTVVKIHLAFKEIEEYVKQFGRGAENKHLTSDIFNLPSDLLIGFIEGYKSADGFVNRYGYNKISSVSKELIYGMGQCIAKAYQRPYSIYHTKRKPTCMIENRIVNQKDTYTIVWKEEDDKQDKAFYDGKYIWCPINSIEKIDYDGLVYNMEVANDNSYTVNNIIVHNCQDLSVAGKQAGLGKGTRSGLLYECKKIIEYCKPKYLLLENVKNLVGKKFKSQFDEWLEYLESLGYTSYWKVLNAKDYGVPQNRERVFVVSILGEHKPYEFPKAIPLDKCIADILEDEVDEKYYMNKPFRLVNKGHQAELDIKGNECIRRVYGIDKIAPTLTTIGGGHREPKVLIEYKGKEKDNYVIEKTYRIRKLTPRECFRLMGMKDSDIDKIQQAGISNTQQYKMAGNSICIPVLEGIFRNLFL